MSSVLDSAAEPAISYLDPAELPRRYGLRVVGNCMAPMIVDGDCIVMDKETWIAPGEIVAVIARPGCDLLGYPGQAIVKEAVLLPPPWISFPVKPGEHDEAMPLLIVRALASGKTFSIRCDQIAAIHRVVAVLPGGAT